MDTNPKTKENVPDDLTGFLSELENAINNIISDIKEIKQTVMDNSSVSFDSLDICISELVSYVKTIKDESSNSSQANPS